MISQEYYRFFVFLLARVYKFAFLPYEKLEIDTRIEF